jgi:hypothetical protein
MSDTETKVGVFSALKVQFCKKGLGCYPLDTITFERLLKGE